MRQHLLSAVRTIDQLGNADRIVGAPPVSPSLAQFSLRLWTHIDSSKLPGDLSVDRSDEPMHATHVAKPNSGSRPLRGVAILSLPLPRIAQAILQVEQRRPAGINRLIGIRYRIPFACIPRRILRVAFPDRDI